MKRLHLICNAHLDPVWQWTWDEGIAAAIATFKSAADLAEEFDYIFCHNESLLYEAVEKYAPNLFARIRKLVKAGKWKIIGAWYLQPDCLMPAGETFVRQIAEGKRYFMEKFGQTSTIAVNFDSFGHSVGLVQILAKNGYKGYMHCRPNSTQLEYPSKFYRWVGPDGSCVIATETFSYSSALGYAKEKILKEAQGANVGMLGADTDGADSVSRNGEVDYVLWGVGNHGGGPSRKDLQNIRELNIDGVEIFHSTPERLFADDIFVGGEIRGSLVTCMPGCLTSMTKIKRAYRETENLYYATEKMLTAAKLEGYAGDLSGMKEAEKKMMLATFHDILPGTLMEDAEKEGLETLNASQKLVKEYRTAAFLYLTSEQRRAGEGEYPVFAFNYQANELRAPVEVEFMLADQNWSDIFQKVYVYDEAGNELPCQQIKERSTLNGLDWRKRVVFEGVLKPFSVTRFTIKTKPVKGQPYLETKPKPAELETFLKGTALNGPAILETYDDTADPWGMSVKELKAVGENPVAFREMTEQEIKEFCAVESGLSAVHIIEDGDVVTATEAMYTNGKTNAVIEYKKYKNHSYTDIKVTLEFADKNKLIRLKVPVPADMQGGKGVGDGPYVWEEKPDSEVYYQKWLGVKQGEDIFAVLNDGVYGGKIENGYLHLTLVRGAGYCFHPLPDRPLYPDDRYLPRIDCGRYTYQFRLFKGNAYEVSAQAEAFNQPPYAVNVFPAGGKEEPQSKLQVDGEVIVSAVKPSADGKGYVVRMYNPANEPKFFTLRFAVASLEATAEKYEVKTFVYSDGKIEEVAEMIV